MSIGDARLRSQMRQFCGGCEAGVEHDCKRFDSEDN
jgi:hypothetical protein